MIYPDYDCQDAEQLRALHVGESPLVQPQQPLAFENAGTGAAIDQLVEHVRWLMRREPMLEREMQPWTGV